MGFQLSADEAASYLHSSKFVGALLGIQEPLLPMHVAHAEALARAIQRRQYAACAEGQMMTQALVAMMQTISRAMSSMPSQRRSSVYSSGRNMRIYWRSNGTAWPRCSWDPGGTCSR